MPAVAGWFRWRTTPDRIRGMAAVTIVAVLLGLIAAVAFTNIAAGLRLIGQQAEPEVLATTHALVALIAINQRAFTGAINAGQQDTTAWTGLIPGAAVVLIGILVLAGVRPRLAEYRYR